MESIVFAIASVVGGFIFLAYAGVVLYNIPYGCYREVRRDG